MDIQEEKGDFQSKTGCRLDIENEVIGCSIGAQSSSNGG